MDLADSAAQAASGIGIAELQAQIASLRASARSRQLEEAIAAREWAEWIQRLEAGLERTVRRLREIVAQ